MKKKNFFGGLYASLALATLGLTTVTLTSCEKESFNVAATSTATTPTLQFDYSTLQNYLNQWGIAKESTLTTVLNSQLTYDQVKSIIDNWNPTSSDEDLKSYLDANYKPELDNIYDILDEWNPTYAQLKDFLDAWENTKKLVESTNTGVNQLVDFINNYVALSDASATIYISVYDWATGSLLSYTSQSIEPSNVGVIASQTVIVECPDIDGYVASNGASVEIPALGKGQSIVIPVTFYVLSVEKAVENGTLDTTGVEVTTDDDAEVVPTTGATETTAMSASEVSAEPIINKVVEIVRYEGQEVTNIDEVNAYIDDMPITRAMTDGAIRSTLKAYVKTFNQGITAKKVNYTIERINPGYIVNVNVTPYYETVAKTLSITVDGIKFEIPNVMVKTVKENKIEEKAILVDESLVPSTPVDPDHTGTDHTGSDSSHTGSHGDSTNAGGGTAGK
jgi:hypothetical protein